MKRQPLLVGRVAPGEPHLRVDDHREPLRIDGRSAPHGDLVAQHVEALRDRDYGGAVRIGRHAPEVGRTGLQHPGGVPEAEVQIRKHAVDLGIADVRVCGTEVHVGGPAAGVAAAVAEQALIPPLAVRVPASVAAVEPRAGYLRARHLLVDDAVGEVGVAGHLETVERCRDIPWVPGKARRPEHALPRQGQDEGRLAGLRMCGPRAAR